MNNKRIPPFVKLEKERLLALVAGPAPDPAPDAPPPDQAPDPDCAPPEQQSLTYDGFLP